MEMKERTRLIEIHEAMLAELREKKAELARQVAEAETVESYHYRRLAELGRVQYEIADDGSTTEEDVDGVSTHMFANGNRLIMAPILKPSAIKGLSRHEAAAEALRAIGKPSRIPAILDVLIGAGHGADLKRNILHNSVYTSMDRKPLIFEKSGPTWGLVEWRKAK